MSDKKEFSENKINESSKDKKNNNKTSSKKESLFSPDRYVQRVKLGTTLQCRRFLGQIVKAILNGEIEDSKARLLNAIVGTILSSIRQDELEKKVTEIEAILNDRNNDKYNPFNDNDEEYFIKSIK